MEPWCVMSLIRFSGCLNTELNSYWKKTGELWVVASVCVWLFLT